MARFLVKLVEPNRGRIIRQLEDGEPWPTGAREQLPYCGQLQVSDSAAESAQRDPRARRRVTRDTPGSAIARAAIQGVVIPITYERDEGWEHELQLTNNGLLQQLELGPVTLSAPGQIDAAFRGRPATVGQTVTPGGRQR